MKRIKLVAAIVTVALVSVMQAGAADYTTTITANGNWSGLIWSPTADPTFVAGDKAAVTNSTLNPMSLTIDEAVTLGKFYLSSANAATLSSSGSGGLTFDNNGTVATFTVGRNLTGETAASAGRAWTISAKLTLHDSANISFLNPQKSTSQRAALESVIDGDGLLNIYYGPSGLNGGGGTGTNVNYHMTLGTSGGAANEHTGGTTINFGPSTDVTEKFYVGIAKNDVFGSGTLTLGNNFEDIYLVLGSTSHTVSGFVRGAEDLGAGTFGAVGSGADKEYSWITGTGIITVVPEPATAGMLLIGLAGVALRRRQKVQQA